MSDPPHRPPIAEVPRAPAAGVLHPVPPPFRCSFSRQGVGTAWVQASGELDLAGAPQLESALRDAQSRARLVVLDLRELAFIDIAGVHVIVDASLRALLAGRRLMIAFAAENISAVFDLTGTSDAVEMLDLDPADTSPGPRLRLVGGQGAR